MINRVFPRQTLSNPRTFLTLPIGTTVKWLQGQHTRGRFCVIGRTKDCLKVEWLDFQKYFDGRWWIEPKENLNETVHWSSGNYCEKEAES